MAELKKCPFCGGEAEIRELIDRDIHGYNIGIRYMVGCIDNDGRCCMDIETGAYRKVEDAIAHWNNRAIEAEIRAKAYEEFAEKLKENPSINDMMFGFEVKRIVDEIAEQLKGKHKEPSRCDTCDNFTSEKTVPPICYLCSKGIEDNYQKGE